jgi:hypothetical protein
MDGGQPAGEGVTEARGDKPRLEPRQRIRRPMRVELEQREAEAWMHEHKVAGAGRIPDHRVVDQCPACPLRPGQSLRRLVG